MEPYLKCNKTQMSDKIILQLVIINIASVHIYHTLKITSNSSLQIQHVARKFGEWVEATAILVEY